MRFLGCHTKNQAGHDPVGVTPLTITPQTASPASIVYPEKLIPSRICVYRVSFNLWGRNPKDAPTLATINSNWSQFYNKVSSASRDKDRSEPANFREKNAEMKETDVVLTRWRGSGVFFFELDTKRLPFVVIQRGNCTHLKRSYFGVLSTTLNHCFH